MTCKLDINDKNWGRCLWSEIHNACERYPQNPSVLDKKMFVKFINDVISKLPCTEECLPHAKKYLEDNKDLLNTALNSRDGVKEFFCVFHNMVNCRIGKKIYLYGYEY